MSIKEECGVFGVFSNTQKDVASMAYYGLYALQHRGQESCGIVVNDDGVFVSHKDLGLVGDVFSKDVLAHFPAANIAIAHARYGTTGKNDRNNCQPIEINHCNGKLALAHNGNLSNAFELRNRLEMQGAIFHTTSDTETIAYLITRARLQSSSLEDAVIKAVKDLEGAFSLCMMSSTKMIALRDKFGFRPLCYGTCDDGSFVVASESCAIKAVGATFVRDLKPGEILVFDKSGVRSIYTYCNVAPKKTCIFEYIYFARPDSVIDGVCVHSARQRAGEILARTYPVSADVVIGVPDSGLDCALGYSRASGIEYGIGFIKNKYMGRTFIAPKQSERQNGVKIKLSVIDECVKDKRVVLIDDSIVRGTTSGLIVKLLREAGAKEIHMRISAPPFLHPCYYGTDIDSQDNLIACHHTTDEIAKLIGVDSLGFLPNDSLCELIGSGEYCGACFDGKYPTKVPTDTRKDRFEGKLSDRKKD